MTVDPRPAGEARKGIADPPPLWTRTSLWANSLYPGEDILARGPGRLIVRGRDPLHGHVRLRSEQVTHGLYGDFAAVDGVTALRDDVEAGTLVAEAVELTDNNLGSCRITLGPDTSIIMEDDLFSIPGLTAGLQIADPQVNFESPDSTMAYATGHLVGAPHYPGEEVKPFPTHQFLQERGVHIGGATYTTLHWPALNAGPWIVTIDSLLVWIEHRSHDRGLHANDIEQEWDAPGTRPATHVIRLERANRASFSPARARAMLRRIEVVLSFAFGVPARPLHVHGYESSGQPMWATFDVNPPLAPIRIDPRVRNWLPSIAASDPEHRFSAGLSRMLASLLADNTGQAASLQVAAARAVDWYVAALNSYGRTESIVLAQASLEVLAAHYLTEHLHLSDRGQSGLDVADQLSVVLASLRIPADIPKHWPTPGRKKGEPRPTGPVFITRARNAAVHPRRSELEVSPEAQTLALWYIEMILLRLLDYRGIYWDRRERAHRTLDS